MPSEEPKSITTMKLSISTKARIEKLRIHPRETYEEILRRILDILNFCRNSPEKARAKLISIEKQKRILRVPSKSI